MPRSRLRWGVIFAGTLGGLAGVSLVGAGATWAWLRTPTGSAWLAPRIAAAITPIGGEARIGTLSTNGWNRVALTDVELVVRPELGGEQQIRVGQVHARLEPMALLQGRVILHDAVLEGVYIDMTPSETVSTEPFVGLGLELVADQLKVQSLSVVYRNPQGEQVVRVAGAMGTANLHAVGAEVRIQDLELAGLLDPMGATTAHIVGNATYDNDGVHLSAVDIHLPSSQLVVDGLAGQKLNLDIDVAHLDGRDANAILGDVGLHGDLSGTARVGGTSSQLTYEVDLAGARDTRGTLAGRGEVDLTQDRIHWTADLQLEQLAVGDLVPEQVQDVTISGRLALTGDGTQYPNDLDIVGEWDGRGDDIYGYVLDEVQTRFQVSEGVVRLTDTQFEGILGELEVVGEVNSVDGPMQLTVQGTVDPSRLREMGITSIDSSGWVRAEIRGNALDSNDPIRVTGTARFAPFRSGPDITVDELQANFQAIQTEDTTTGEATWTASGMSAYGVEIAQLKGESTPFTSGPDGYEANGTAQAQTLVMPDTFNVSTAQIQWSTSSIRGDRTEATIEIGSHDLMTFPGTDGIVRAEMLGNDLRISARLNDGPRALLHTSGTAKLDTRAYVLDQLTLGLTPRATWKATRPVQFTLTDTGLQDADIHLTGNLGQAELVGTLGTRGTVDAHVRMTKFSLDTLAELAPESAGGLAGVMDMDLTLSGLASNPSGTALWKIDGLWVEDTTRWLDVEGKFELDNGQLNSTLRMGVAGTLLAHATGTLPLHSDLSDPKLNKDETVDLSFAIVGGSLERLQQAFPSAEGLPPGQVGGALTLSGHLGDPKIRMAGITEIGVPGWPNQARVEFEVTREGPALSGWLDVRDGYDARLRIGGFGQTDVAQVLDHLFEHGSVPEDIPLETWANRLAIQGKLLDFPARSLMVAADLPLAVSGDLVGGFGIRGSLESPVLESSIQWIRGALGRQELPLASIDLVAADNGYELQAKADFGEEELTVRGQLPIQPRLSEPLETWSNGEMGLIVEGKIPLLTLTSYNNKLASVEGSLELRGGIRGVLDDPKPALVGTIEGGSLSYHPAGLRATSIDLRLVAHPQEIRLDEFRMQTAPSRRRTLASNFEDLGDGPPSLFEAQGRAILDHGMPDRVAGTISLSGGTWVMNTPETVLRMNGDVDISGQWPHLQIGGDLALHSGSIVIDAAAFLDQAPLQPDPRIRLIRDGAVAQRQGDAEGLWYEEVEANVDLRLGRSLELSVGMPFVDDLGALGAAVSRADLTARLGGKVALGMSQATPTMVGEVDLAEGSLRVLRSRFTLDSGTLLFTGNDYSEPNMDIRATMTVSDAAINTHVTGTPSQPFFDSQSDQYPDQSAILMIMLTGRLPEDTDGGDGSGMPQMLAGLVLDSLLGAQNLGNVSLSSDGTVRVGAPLSPTLYATVIASPAPDLTDNHFAGSVEWNIAPKVVMATSIGDVTSWLDLYWEIRF